MNINWQPIETAPEDVFLLVARESGMLTTPWEYMTAQNDPTYKGWVDPQVYRRTAGGDDPLYWAPLPEAPA